MFAKLTGGLTSGLTALAGFGSSAFPYTVEDAYPSAWGQWAHHKGTAREDGSAVSIFKVTATDPNDRKLVVARNGIRRLKMLRHPNILAFKDSHETTEKGATVIYLVTQAVKPLKLVLEELDLKGQHRDEYLAMGMLHMTNAVSFLNNDCKLIHGNICLEAVVVTETLDWKLHGFDLVSEHTLPGDFALTNATWMVGNQYKPAELGKSEWETIRQSPPWAVDAWGLGCLMQEVFSTEYMQSVENLRRTDLMPQALLADYQKLLSSAPSRRLNPAKVAESKFLNNRLVDVVNFMENIAVKDSIEKDTFFKRLPSLLPSIPSAVAVRKILPGLSSALEFGGAPAHAVGSLMLIGNQLDTDEFTKRVVPTLSKLFASQDRNLRRSLLEGLDSYGQHLSTAVIEEQIYPHLQNGFTDSNPYLRELTLKSILTLAPKLTNKTLTQNVLKHLSRLQVDEEPSIRANTTVLLGNVAKYLGDATCKRVLLNAFTRALKDMFPPAKVAGLRAMVATATYHNAEDAAMRILPSVAPLTIDPIGEVRQAALQCLDIFTTTLNDDHKRRMNEAAAAGAAAGAGGDGNTAAQSPTIGAGSVLTWAVSSLMSSTGLAVKPPSAPDLSRSVSGAAAQTSSATPAPAPSSSTSTATRPTSAKPAPAAAPSRPAAGSSAGAGADGWGELDDEMEGWDNEELQVDEEEVKARSRLMAKPASAASSSSRPAAGPPAAPAAAAPAASGGWDTGSLGDDAEGEGWEGMESLEPVAPKPAPAARPRPARPAGGSSGGAGGAAAGAKKPMKLGAQKLGVQKLSAD
mmetsp:Transcript_8758/g.18684  ORF Transcript_8758/g.18684 Transcript_8758/m.18684 type:complete len:802 (-) Transcript_8758:459-2864(-)